MPGILLTHGAGSNSQAPLLRKIAAELTGRGWLIQLYDLPFRQKRPSGPPRPTDGVADRAGLQTACAILRSQLPPGDRLVLSGHSYGGRQATMLGADEPAIADLILAWSYPLHPPGKPEQLRTAHFPNLRTPAIFASGERDDFGTPDELRAALALIPAPTHLELFPKFGHSLSLKADFSIVYDLLQK